MLQIDGSYGEGGGQILRTSLSLAAITGRPIQIVNIRAKRAKPGLAIQHLTGVRAAATLCQAELKGDRVGSTQLEFIPTQPVQASNYTFDVAQTAGTGSAGAVTLVLQTILLPLALAKGDSRVRLKGGTFVAHSPPAPYIEQIYLPILQQMGVQATLTTLAWGWYPRGGGELELQIKGDTDVLQPIELLTRGALKQVKGFAIATELPAHIPQRMVKRAEQLLTEANFRVHLRALREPGIGPGTGIFLSAEYQQMTSGFGAVGKMGLPAEAVAAIATQDLLAYDHTNAPVDVHLADQLLLPAILASAPSRYHVSEISLHLTTNAWVIEQFGLGQITIDHDTHQISVNPIR